MRKLENIHAILWMKRERASSQKYPRKKRERFLEKKYIGVGCWIEGRSTSNSSRNWQLIVRWRACSLIELVEPVRCRWRRKNASSKAYRAKRARVYRYGKNRLAVRIEGKRQGRESWGLKKNGSRDRAGAAIRAWAEIAEENYVAVKRKKLHVLRIAREAAIRREIRMSWTKHRIVQIKSGMYEQCVMPRRLERRSGHH